MTACSNHPDTPNHMEAKELIEKIKTNEKIIILDSRSKSEFDSGHIKGAIHFSFWKSFWNTNKLKINKHDPIIVYCGHGPRAGIVKVALLCNGFDNITYLKGHMTKWKADNLPLEKSK